MTGLTTAWVQREMAARGYQVLAGPDWPITGGAADSRRVRPGDLFTAFPGEHLDGNDYVAAALEAGAVAAICMRAPQAVPPATTVVVAPDATAAVGELAAAWRRACGPRVAGITGTVGKTTAKEVTASVLAARFRVHRSEGNLNSREGLPLALLSLRTEHEVSVLEMGMDSPGEIARLCEIAAPEVGVVLNIGLTHVEKLGSVEVIAVEKLSLARLLPPDGTAVLNVDDPRIAEAHASITASIITFGSCAHASLRRGAVTSLGLDGVTFELFHGGRRHLVRSPLPGEHVIPAVLSACGVALALGMPLAEAIDALEGLQSDGLGRIHVRALASGATLLDDRYNSSPASLAGALHLLGTIEGRRIAFLGKMAELGAHEEEEHRKAGVLAAGTADLLFTFGPVCRTLADAARRAGLGPDARWFPDKTAAARALAAVLQPGDTVLLKGSRSEALEEAIPLLDNEDDANTGGDA